jgi:hypothetical protein
MSKGGVGDKRLEKDLIVVPPPSMRDVSGLEREGALEVWNQMRDLSERD